MSIIFTEKDKKFEFDVLGYEFQNIVEDDEELSNWLLLNISYSSNDKNLSEVVNCLLTYEIEEIIDNIDIIISGKESSILLTFFEPYIMFAIVRGDKKYALQFRYVDNRVGWKILSVCDVMDLERLLEVKSEFQRMYEKFPYRETKEEYSLYKKNKSVQ